ncbi:hypothetical protein AZH11_19755 [Pseudomonas simiae]|nr:hypothetical protein AZH11_19755 [Pseudomonas simiae]
MDGAVWQLLRDGGAVKSSRRRNEPAVSGVQAGFELFGQFAGLGMRTAKTSDPAAGHFQDMKEIAAGRYNLVKNGIGVPVGVI